MTGPELARTAAFRAYMRRKASRSSHLGPYATDPAGYARDVLGITWWARQAEIAAALLTPPYRVLVKAGHSVGKTYLGGSLVNWWYDSFDPGIVLTTAPTDRQVTDLLWKEVRVQRANRGGFAGPRASRLESAPDHFAHGFTARDGDSFQGHHTERLLIIFDEAVGVSPVFWETAETMFAGAGHAWLAIFNPTDTGSQAYLEDLSDKWHTIEMSALDHPNIAAELAGEAPPYPGAVRLGQVETWLADWCEPVVDAPAPTDIEWPPGSGTYLRPGPLAEPRILGRWPSQGSYAVWSDAAFGAAERAALPEPTDIPPEIGCDVARFGDDFTTIHVRRGPVSLHHERGNGWGTDETAGRLKRMADEWGQRAGTEGRRVSVKVDDDGVGGGVIDQRGDYTFLGVSAASVAREEERYPNRRSELWFAAAERGRERRLDLSRLSLTVRNDLRRQAMAPLWKVDGQGRRVVEPKQDTKKRLKRSPDDMDGLNLAYAPESPAAGVSIERSPVMTLPNRPGLLNRGRR